MWFQANVFLSAVSELSVHSVPMAFLFSSKMVSFCRTRCGKFFYKNVFFFVLGLITFGKVRPNTNLNILNGKGGRATPNLKAILNFRAHFGLKYQGNLSSRIQLDCLILKRCCFEQNCCQAMHFYLIIKITISLNQKKQVLMDNHFSKCDLQQLIYQYENFIISYNGK